MTHKYHVRKDMNPTLMGREKVRDRSCYVFAFFFSCPCSMQDLIPWPGTEPVPSVLGAWSLNHWMTREVPGAAVLAWAPFSAPSGVPGSSAGKEYTCNAGDPRLIPGSGRSPGEAIGYPFQYSWAFLVAQMVKIYLQCGRSGFDPWVGKIP